MIRGVHRLRQLSARLRRWGKPTALILLYHRVAELERDPQWLAVTPRRFREQMEELASIAEVVPLADLPTHLTGQRSSHRPLVAISFDDGYLDNLESAAPVLSSIGVPATVFATTGFVDGTREFFWDDLERLILAENARLPAVLKLAPEYGIASIHVKDDEKGAGSVDWNATHLPTCARQELYVQLCTLMAPLTHEQRCLVVDGIREQIGGQREGRMSHRVMSSAELRRLDATGIVTVGSHTRWHLKLSAHTPAVQRDEIVSSRDYLVAALGHPIPMMAYPFGTTSDYGSSTRMIAQEAGFSVSCSNHMDVTWAGSDMRALPRMLVRNWNRDEFSERIANAMKS